ncbi:MAG: hypothetical protein D6708_05005 [Candidatus Dadabacteria bacterium]|nr:MAG: hypothetical protein D6708_05005 [Candidatus Dadabacteria bacterium]
MRARIGLVSALFLLLAAVAFGQEPPPPGGSHGELSCDECHTGPRIEDCWACHEAVENPHPVGVAPKTAKIPEGLPLAPDGALLCRTCHRIHGGAPEQKFLLLEPGMTRMGFCITCHGSSLEHANPHKARRGEGRCGFCHLVKAGRIITGRGSARLEVKRLCNFCHDVLAKGHPRNVDPDLSLPKDVPLGPEGEWTCFTCHNPHGTTETTHLLRSEVARHLERGQAESPHVPEYFACKACHTTADPDAVKADPGRALRYRGDINVLCISCHVTDRSHHPTGFPPVEEMLARLKAAGFGLRFGPDGEITCYTCHDNGCDTGQQRMRERFYDRSRGRSDLCGGCHNRSMLTQKSPHVDDPKICPTCHVAVPVPGSDEGRELVASQKMVCLRCHSVNLHPANADHLKVPSEKIKPDESLPLGTRGEVTCSTCHNPHEDPEHRRARLRADAQSLCSLCHWR